MEEKRTLGNATDDNNTLQLLTRHSYSNHLQSASLELDTVGAIISYEEYHPYGTTAYQAMSATIKACAKRYRYTGKERDEESGLYYHMGRGIMCLGWGDGVRVIHLKVKMRLKHLMGIVQIIQYLNWILMGKTKLHFTILPVHSILIKHNQHLSCMALKIKA